MLAFENKIFGIVIFPFNLQKEFLMHLMRLPTEGSLSERLNFYTVHWAAAASMVSIPFHSIRFHISTGTVRTSLSELGGCRLFSSTAADSSSSSSSICTWAPMLPPEIQPEYHCHSDKWIVTGKAYQCQRQAARRDFDSALFPGLNRRLCFAKQTNKQRTWRVWWKSKQHGPVTCPITMTLPK